MPSPMRHKNWKPVLALLSGLTLISAIVTSRLIKVEASNPNQGSLTMHLVLVTPEYDGEHAIADSLQTELAKIGITLLIDYRDPETYTATIGPYSTHWNITWDSAPNLGWDLQFWEFWGMPTSLRWWPWMYSAAGMPSDGWQIMSWNNTKADALLEQQFEEFDPAKRRQLMLLYQNEWIHDTPGPVLYSPEFIQVVDKRFQTPWGTPGWEDAAWWYDPFLYTWVEDPMPETVTVKWATSSQWYVYNPMYMWTYAQDLTTCLTHSMLYVVSKEYGSAVGEDYTVRPYLALDDPVWAHDYLTCNISLRDDVYWHNITDIWTDPGNPVEYNNELFTADDVVMTFEALMHIDIWAWYNREYVDVLDTSVHHGGVEKLDDFTVRFHLKKPYVELKDLLANEWAAFILPEHILGDVPFKDWYGHWTNDVDNGWPPPGTGPYKFVEHNRVDDYWRLEAVLNYPTGLNPFNCTPVIDEIIGYQITDPWPPLPLPPPWPWPLPDIHFSPDGLYLAPEQVEALNATGEFWVFYSPIPATRHLMFNLNHPILSNRYVRQAIAHAINYQHIVDDILPTYCLEGTLQATPVWPMMEWAYPTPADEALYNTLRVQHCKGAAVHEHVEIFTGRKHWNTQPHSAATLQSRSRLGGVGTRWRQ